jgi:hypothetical protein
LAAVRFYLRMALLHCQQAWEERAQGITTYKTLIDQIRRHFSPDEHVCCVTFNYDTLLDSALRDSRLQLNSLDDYTANLPFSLVKIHGSVDWVREVSAPSVPAREGGTIWDTVRFVIERAADLRFGSGYLRDDNLPIANVEGRVFIPAIAIPLERKQDFECPARHCEHLVQVLPNVSKILLIGWRATDEPFLELLRTRMLGRPRAHVVAKDEAEARSIVLRVANYGVILGETTLASHGFSEFVVRREGEAFLKA